MHGSLGKAKRSRAPTRTRRVEEDRGRPLREIRGNPCKWEFVYPKRYREHTRIVLEGLILSINVHDHNRQLQNSGVVEQSDVINRAVNEYSDIRISEGTDLSDYT